MMLNNSKLKLISLALVSLVLVGVLGFGFYQIRSESKESSRLLHLADQAEEEQALAKSIRLLQNTASQDIQSFEDKVLTEDRIVSVIESIESMGESLGLATKTLSIDKASSNAGENPHKITIAVEADGSWRGNFAFIQAIESLPQRVMIDGLTLSKGVNSWNSRVTLSLFSFD